MLEFIKAMNPILAVDSYKVPHSKMLPKGILQTYSVIVPRKASDYTSEIVVNGNGMLYAFLQFMRITKEHVDEALEECNSQGYEFDRKPWDYIVRELNGKLPLAVYGVPDGTVIKPNTPTTALVATDARFAWLPSYYETIAQRIVWKMSTVSTVSRYCYKQIQKRMELTGADMSMLEYSLHNFGDRGADGYESAVLAGMAHAALFSGSDCLSANRYIKRLYWEEKNYLSSIDATEHSVMCSWANAIEKDDYGAADYLINEYFPTVVARAKNDGIGIPVMAIVIDTYDSHRFISEYIGKLLKEDIINSGGRIVLRPDSGDPLVEPIEIIKLLDEAFGHTVNEKGYKVLPPYIRVIQGDGINVHSITKIMDNVIAAGYSMDNIVFGMGGGLTHEAGRDEFSWSQKATWIEFDDFTTKNLLKEPKTDLGKKSLTGLVYVDEYGEVARAESIVDIPTYGDNWILYSMNKIDNKFQEVRARARS